MQLVQNLKVIFRKKVLKLEVVITRSVKESKTFSGIADRKN